MEVNYDDTKTTEKCQIKANGITPLTYDVIQQCDPVTILSLAEEHGVLVDGLKNVEDIQERLQMHCNLKQHGSIKEMLQKARTDANKDIEGKFEQLVEILYKTKDLVSQIEDQSDDSNTNLEKTEDKEEETKRPTSGLLRSTLREEGVSNNIIQDLENEIKSFQDNDCRIVVAGETTSGKSTLLNLLFDNHELLPTHVKSCTSTVTIIRYGRKRSARISHGSGKEETLLLDEEDGRARLEKVVFQEEEERETDEIKEVEIFIPHPLLKGLVLIDTPGIGESEYLEEKLMQYISSNTVHGFIYLIQTDHAGGVQEDRIITLLKMILQRYKDDIQHTGFSKFYPKAAMFICNRFDLIPEDSRAHVSRNAINELRKCWPHLDETQVFFFSALRAKDNVAINPDYISNDYRQILEGIAELRQGAMEHKMRDCYRWLKKIHRRSQHHTCTKINSIGYSNTEVQERIKEAKSKLQTLGEKADKVIEDLRNRLDETASEISKQVEEFIQRPYCKKMLVNDWDEATLPRLSQKKKDKALEWGWVKFHIDKAFYDKLSKMLLEWDEETHVIIQNESDVSRIIKQELNLLDSELASLESKIDGGISSCSVQPCHIDLQPYESKIPFGLVGSLVSKVKSKADIVKVNQYWSDPGKVATHRAAKLYKSLLSNGDENVLLPFVRQLLDRPYGYINVLENHIPKFIRSNQLLLQKMASVQSQEEELKIQYKQLSQDFKKVSKALSEFGDISLFINEFRRYQVSVRRTNSLGASVTQTKPSATLEDKERIIALKKANAPCSLWTVIEHGKLNVYDIEKPVSVKMYQREAQVHNTAEEGRKLRYLIFKEMNLAEFLGAYHFDTRNSAFIFNGKLWSLTKFLKQPCITPGSKEVILLQVARGLQYLHTKGFVHMELSRDSVTVDTKGNVRLTGMGLARKTQLPPDLSFPAGNFVFLEPRVLGGEVYEASADIYGFGLLLLDLLVFLNGIFVEEREKMLSWFMDLPNPIKQLNLPKVMSNASSSLQNVVQDCVRMGKAERVAINTVVEQISTLVSRCRK